MRMSQTGLLEPSSTETLERAAIETSLIQAMKSTDSQTMHSERNTTHQQDLLGIDFYRSLYDVCLAIIKIKTVDCDTTTSSPSRWSIDEFHTAAQTLMRFSGAEDSAPIYFDGCILSPAKSKIKLRAKLKLVGRAKPRVWSGDSSTD
jgi:hypothetical protein